MIRRRLALFGVVTATAGMISAGAVTAAAADARPADLGMARLADFQVAVTAGGQSQLRFSATIVNVGSGPFELSASRASTSDPWQVRQLTAQSDGSRTSSGVLPVGMVYGGDGHGHWHIKDLEGYELKRLDNGVKVGTALKSGFCFFDTTAYKLGLAGAPQTGQYTSSSCGAQDVLSASMGLSVGWGDRYPWTLPDQYINVTGLANGKYRLVATADAGGVFAESNEANNATWVDLQLSSRRGVTSVKVLGYGPSA